MLGLLVFLLIVYLVRLFTFLNMKRCYGRQSVSCLPVTWFIKYSKSHSDDLDVC